MFFKANCKHCWTLLQDEHVATHFNGEFVTFIRNASASAMPFEPDWGQVKLVVYAVFVESPVVPSVTPAVQGLAIQHDRRCEVASSMQL